MALFSRKKQAVGLDIGHGAVKAVHVVPKGKELAIKQMVVLDAHQEGILDEEELRSSMLAWLGENGLRNRPFTVGIPQFLATTQVSDFPPGVKDEELRDMVSFETSQLGGLSDESFSSDYHVMEPKFGRSNPVLIGVCRQSVIDERMGRLTRDGVNVVDLGMNGLAVANAFYYLHPAAIEDDRPSILMDIGDEGTTLLVVAGGQVLFAGSLMFGASRYTEVLASQLGCDEAQADRRKREFILDPEMEENPLHAVTAQLESEMRNAIEHWRSAEKEELADLLFGQIWLTGGGAALGGLTDCLGRFFGCEAVVFGPPDAETGESMPALSAALGLALQSMEAAQVSVSLAPLSLRWLRRRRRLFPFLVAAELIFIGLLAAALVRYHFHLTEEKLSLERELNELRECQTLIPKLDEQMTAMDHHERMLVPFVEKANRAQRYISTLNELHRVRGTNNFFVYVADRLSYDEQRPEPETDAGITDDNPRRRRARGALGAAMFNSAPDALGGDRNPELLDATLVKDMEQLVSMVAFGYAPYVRIGRYKALKELEERLKQGSLFKQAGPIPLPDRQGIEEQIYNSWNRFWAEKPSKGNFFPFNLDMRFAELDVNKKALSPPTPQPNDKKKKKKK